MRLGRLLVVSLCFVAVTSVSWSKPARRGRARARGRAPAQPADTSSPNNDLPPEEEPGPTPSAPAESPDNLKRGGRVEFDNRLVQGQTAKADAIYLFARKRTELRSMVDERMSYRQEIMRTVYPDYGSADSPSSNQRAK